LLPVFSFKLPLSLVRVKLTAVIQGVILLGSVSLSLSFLLGKFSLVNEETFGLANCIGRQYCNTKHHAIDLLKSAQPHQHIAVLDPDAAVALQPPPLLGFDRFLERLVGT
jgi:hypothetical protein